MISKIYAQFFIIYFIYFLVTILYAPTHYTKEHCDILNMGLIVFPILFVL